MAGLARLSTGDSLPLGRYCKKKKKKYWETFRLAGVCMAATIAVVFKFTINSYVSNTLARNMNISLISNYFVIIHYILKHIHSSKCFKQI